MPRFNPIKETVQERRLRDNQRADIARNKAHVDYIAMMCDVEIPEPDAEEVTGDEG